MVSIAERGRFYQIKICRKDYSPVAQMLDTKAEANARARMTESEMDRGIFPHRSELENTTLRQLLDDTRAGATPGGKFGRGRLLRSNLVITMPLH
jgi:hypothetical protein